MSFTTSKNSKHHMSPSTGKWKVQEYHNYTPEHYRSMKIKQNLFRSTRVKLKNKAEQEKKHTAQLYILHETVSIKSKAHKTILTFTQEFMQTL